VNAEADRTPVTAVSCIPVAPARLPAFRVLHERSVRMMRSMPGFVHAELFEPVPGVQEDAVVLLSFDTREHLDGWLRSDARKELVALQAEHLVGPRTVSVVRGFAGWFDTGRENEADDVVRWKSAVAVLLAIVPVSQLFLGVRLWLLPDVNVVFATLLGNVVSVAALTWVLMPRISRRLARWLRR
jgi:antibiotic biosynthesis monooxygenase (ABM) superfamily enzyme